VIVCTAFKDIVEDVKRHKSDDKENNSVVTRIVGRTGACPPRQQSTLANLGSIAKNAGSRVMHRLTSQGSMLFGANKQGDPHSGEGAAGDIENNGAIPATAAAGVSQPPVVTGSFYTEKAKWKELKIGDIVKARNFYNLIFFRFIVVNVSQQI
jgi:hypothetical protein